MTAGGRTRRTGLAVAAAGAAVVVISTFLPWIEFRGITVDLWDLTGIESVVIAASAFVAVAFAVLGLARGGRELPAVVAAAVMAGVTLAIVDDMRAAPDSVRGSGDTVAGVGAIVALAAVALLIAAAGGARPRIVRAGAALAAVALALVFGQNALQVHPEIQVIR